MRDLSKYDGAEFEIPDSEVSGSCIDYWFDEQETEDQSQNNPLVPPGHRAIARDPGDDLILSDPNGSILYCIHETGRTIKLAANLDDFINSLKT